MPKPVDGDLRQETKMQAVVLADSFASNFRPVTFQQPKVLMPLVNVPMLEYTCEFLAAGGMHEIFIFCCSHKEEVTMYTAAGPYSVKCQRCNQHASKLQRL